MYNIKYSYNGFLILPILLYVQWTLCILKHLSSDIKIPINVFINNIYDLL